MRKTANVGSFKNKIRWQFAGDRKVDHVGIGRFQLVIQSPGNGEPAWGGGADRRRDWKRAGGRGSDERAGRRSTPIIAAGWEIIKSRVPRRPIHGLNSSWIYFGCG